MKGNEGRSLIFLFRLKKCLVPGQCQDVKASAINSTAAHVSWKPPLEKERNGMIRGYHIHVQEVRDDVSKISH